MKKLTIEEKAKRYDEAIKKAKSKIKDDKDHVLYENDVIEIFPALKESEGGDEKQELSDEDQKIITKLIGIFETVVDGGSVMFPYRLLKDYTRVLKSCLHQSTWKPSDKQMKQLGWIAEQNKDNMIGKELMTLYQDLKKLK